MRGGEKKKLQNEARSASKGEKKMNRSREEEWSKDSEIIVVQSGTDTSSKAKKSINSCFPVQDLKCHKPKSYIS